MNDEMKLSPQRPYIARAMYEWLCDNRLTPHILVDANYKYTYVPQQFVKDGQIVLNIAPHAVHQFHIDNDAVSFSARFGGVSQQLYIPMPALLGIYARENGAGLFFDPNEYDDVEVSPRFQEVDDVSTVSEKNSSDEKKSDESKPAFSFVD